MFFKEVFQKYLTNTEGLTRRYVTLGPNGTSSSHAVNMLAESYPAKIHLFDTFEKAALEVTDQPTETGLVVANAYSNINKFYISYDLIPAGAYFHDTPAYVIAAKTIEVLNHPRLKLATHPAPSHLVDEVLDHPDVQKLYVDSTYLAAQLTQRGQCDACLTTSVAAKMLGLDTLAVAIPAIPMLWTVFIHAQYEENVLWSKKPSLSYATTSRTA